MSLPLFAFFGALAVFSALGMILQRNPVHALLSFALTLLDIGILFMGLGAVTVGFLQISIYVGAIMVLFLFVIWLLNLQSDPPLGGRLWLKLVGAIGASALAAELASLFVKGESQLKSAPLPADYGSLASLAKLLFSDYLVAFEVTSVLLLAAVVGAIGLARRIPASSARQTVEEHENFRSAAG